MSKRPRGVPPMTRIPLVVLLALLIVPVAALPALAVEGAEGGETGAVAEEAPPPDVDELCQANDVVAEFCPEPYEQPTVFPPILYALLGAGALLAIVLFLMYMRWLPNFAQERRAKTKGRT